MARTFAKQLVGAGLEERHLAGGDPVQRRLARVVDADAQAGIGQREAERQPDVAPATEDDDVEIAGLLGHAQESTDAVRPVTAPNVLVRGTRH